MSDNQVFRMEFWSISLRSTFGNYAKFGLPDFPGSQLASLSFEQHSASTTIISSLILSISGTYKYFWIYEELRLFYGTYKYGYLLIYEEERATRFTFESDTCLPSTPSYWEKSLHTVQVLLSPEDFIVSNSCT